ncbi:MAG: ASKHA domain-containing protein [bacterium]
MAWLIHDGGKVELSSGKTLFDHADLLQVRVPTSCRRNGECHECIVEIRRGMDALSQRAAPETFLGEGFRLACQATVVAAKNDVEFALSQRQPRILTESILSIEAAGPPVTRQGDGVYFAGNRIDTYRGRMLGLAIDIGTTTVALNLADLENSEVLYTASFENPQRFGGSDIMNRISYDGGMFRGEMQKAIVAAANFEIGEMSRQLKIRRRQIYEVVVVGNPTMRDLFFGMDVQPLGEKPYKSVAESEFRRGRRKTTAVNRKARGLGLRVHPRANVYGGPLIASHVGADAAADLLAIGIEETREPVMLLDVGTNTEIVVGTSQRMLAASCPAGPAFEGGQISHGMPGHHGAVESVRIRKGGAVCRTIGGLLPKGICGSGLVDLLAELRGSGRMDELGRLDGGETHFQFCREPPMSISRADISALAQAKSANYTGQYIVLRHFGLPLHGITKLFLAGGFANYLDLDNAMAIGLIAEFPPERIIKAGNAALAGATIMLLSEAKRRWIEDFTTKIEHIELETVPDFFDIFVEGCLFKPLTTNPI